MSSPTPDHKRRPPPIAIPHLPSSRAVPVPHATNHPPSQTMGSGQYAQRIASSSTQHGKRSGANTPLTSPLDFDESRLVFPKSGSQASRHRSSAMTNLTDLVDQARGSPRKSDYGSTASRHNSTARSRQSERSQRSATAAQARLEALDEGETTLRSRIESRTEKQLFKMTGQIPPTPTTGALDPDRIFIRTEDLRAQCRAASGEKQAESDEPTKSPKKKLFGVSLPTFTRASAISTVPDMPTKAAKLLGADGVSGQKPRRIQPRPIKSAQVLKTPTKMSRSGTVGKTLPAKVRGSSYTETNLSATTCRICTTGRQSPGKENTPPQQRAQATANSSFESMPPPTPPAKDTPPEYRLPAGPPSPLRRAPSRDNLRESYGTAPDRGIQVQLPFPMFALSPSPPKIAVQGTGGESPSKFQPFTAEDYTKLIDGKALGWRFSNDEGDSVVKEGNFSGYPVKDCHELLQLPLSSHGDDDHYSERLSQRLSPLPPRFYSPSNRSVQMFKEGESPSQNTDTTRMLFTPPVPITSLLHLREDSNNGSIEMVYQGSMKAAKSESSEAQAANSSDLQTQEEQTLTVHQQGVDNELAASVRQELRIGEQPTTNANAGRTHLETDNSSSRLTDMLKGASPWTDPHGEPRAFCPSAVPSPLHKLVGPHVTVQPVPMLRGGSGTPIAGPFISPRTPHKTIEDHFFMTNEHLDVVGKTTYDALDVFTRRQISAANTKHDQLVVAIDKHVEGLQTQIGLVNDKAENASNQMHSVGLKLDQLDEFLKDEVIGYMKQQAKKAAEVESSLKEMQMAMAHLQQTVEKLGETKAPSQLPASNALPAPVAHATPTHHSQPALNNYYDASRDDHAPMPSLQHRNVSDNFDSHGDQRGNYGTNWQSQAWNGRSTHHGRNKGETSSYAGTNPYQFGNGGQYNSNYMNGYSSNYYSPTSHEQPYAYGQKPAQ